MNFISRIIKSINAMRERLKIERHEAMNIQIVNVKRKECIDMNLCMKRVRRIDQGGIPTLDTIFSNVDTTNNTVTYGICPFQWRQLPCRGLILLNINHTAGNKYLIYYCLIYQLQ